MLAVLALAGSAGFVCPPRPVEEVAKLEGEPCGGACDSYGKCGEGLECFVEKPKTSPFSFAIIMGKTEKAGVCASAATIEERRKLQLGGRTLAGGQVEASIESPEVAAAAKQALVFMMRASNSLTPPNLSKIISAQTQVVAGIKYTLELELSDGSHHRVAIVDQAWMNPRYSLVEHVVL